MSPFRQRSTVGLTDAPTPPGDCIVEDLGIVRAERPLQLFGNLARVVADVEDDLRHEVEAVGANYAVSVRVRVRTTLLSVGAEATGRAVRTSV